MVRIAHICTRFSRLSETFIYDLIVGLEQAGAENHVLTAARMNAGQRRFDRVRTLRIPLWKQAAFAFQKNCMGVYDFPWPSADTRQALLDIRPHVVLAHFGGAGAAIAPITRELNLPLVVVFHAFDLFTQPFTPAMYAGLWRTLAGAVAISNHGRARLVDTLGCPADKVSVIHCGVDLARFSPSATPRPDGTPMRLVTICRLMEKKGTDDLIRAVALARRTLPTGLSLDILGNGPRRKGLERLARASGVNDLVRFPGAPASRDVPRLLQEYDAFVLPSKTARNGDTEGIPITILEAQAAGLPVVSTVHAGIPEAIPPANHHLLAKENDPRDLALKLEWLGQHRNQWPELGARGRQWVLSRFSLLDEVAAYLRLLESTASARPHEPAPAITSGRAGKA